MTATRTRLASARRYLEVFEESWKADHDGAMRCRDFEETVVEAVKVFELVDELVRWRRECVFRGVEEPNPQLDEEEKALFTDWLALVEDAMPRLEALEKTYGIVKGADRLRACRERARSFLAQWRPAVLSMAVGLRMQELTEEDAEELRALLEQPSPAGRPRWEPRPIPPGDPSLLR
jgi:hypothetical protein